MAAVCWVTLALTQPTLAVGSGIALRCQPPQKSMPRSKAGLDELQAFNPTKSTNCILLIKQEKDFQRFVPLDKRYPHNIHIILSLAALQVRVFPGDFLRKTQL